MLGEISPRLRSLVAGMLSKITGSGVNGLLYLDSNQSPAVATNVQILPVGTSSKVRIIENGNSNSWIDMSVAGGPVLTLLNSVGSAAGISVASITGVTSYAAGNVQYQSTQIYSQSGQNLPMDIAGTLTIQCGRDIGGSPITFAARASQTVPLTRYQAYSSTSTLRSCGYIDATFNSNVDASWTGKLSLYAGDYTSTNAGQRLGIQIQSNGSVAQIGFYGSTPVSQPSGSISTALTSLGLMTAPTLPVRIVTPQADADAATITVDFSLSDFHQIAALGGNRTITFANASPGQMIRIEIQQPASGGPYTVTWSNTIRWAGGTAPTLATSASKCDAIVIMVRGDGTYAGALSIPNY